MNAMLKTAGLSLLASGLIACGGDENQDAAVPQNYHDITTNLQGTVFNAITGERISSEGLSVTLVQGGDYRKAKINKNFQGDFFVGDIPTSTAGNITYRLDVSYTGYQPFTSLIGFGVNTNPLQDKEVATVGNVYLYPLGATAPDQTVSVTYNGEPVPDATVLMQPDTSSNTLTTDIASRLFASAGYQQALQATTDANGIATFTGANLTLGGRYNVDVLPLAYEGKQLAVNRAAALINIGQNNITRVVTMGDLLPGSENGLYVVDASNEDTDALQSDGVLTLKMSQPVEIVNEANTVTAVLANNTTAALDFTGTGTEVNATVSTDGLTITLAPKFATGANPVVFNGTNAGTADNGLTITYSNLFVRMTATNDNAMYDVFNTNLGGGVVDTSGTQVTGTVTVTPEF